MSGPPNPKVNFGSGIRGGQSDQSHRVRPHRGAGQPGLGVPRARRIAGAWRALQQNPCPALGELFGPRGGPVTGLAARFALV